MRGLQTKCGASLLTSSGIGKPSPGAPHCETHRHALCYQDMFGRCEETLHALLRPWVSWREKYSALLQVRVLININF